MSICGVSGNSIAVVYQKKSSLESVSCPKILGFYTTSLQEIDFIDIITDFHHLYTLKSRFYKDPNTITDEGSIKYHYKYCEDLITCLKKHPEPIYKEMALLLRIVQSFVLSPTISLSLIKLYDEYFPPLFIQKSSNFDENGFFHCIKSGKLDQAQSIIRSSPIKSPIKEHLLSILEPSSRVFGLIYTSDSDFIPHFESITSETKTLYNIWGHDKNYTKIIKILKGEINTFLTLNPNWLEFLIYHCLFIEGFFYDTENVVSIINERIGVDNDFEKLLLIVVKRNMHEVVQVASKKYPAFFIAHLVDILATAEQLPKELSWRFEDMNYPEYYFWVYINEIFTNEQVTLEILCDYILSTLGGLIGIQDLILKAACLRLASQDFNAMVSYLNQVCLSNISCRLFVYKSVSFLNANDFPNGLLWAFKSKNKPLQLKAEKIFLNFAKKQTKPYLENLLQTIDPLVKSKSSAISFLHIYLHYLQYINQKQTTQAGELLIKFFTDQLSPESFYDKILLSSIELFNQGLILSYSNFISVLEGYEKLANRCLNNKPYDPCFLNQISSILAYNAGLSLGSKS